MTLDYELEIVEKHLMKKKNVKILLSNLATKWSAALFVGRRSLFVYQ